MNRANVIIALILATGLGVVLFWFFTNFERQQVTEEIGFSSEARANPMLAAARMLRTMGLDARLLEPGTWDTKLTPGVGTLFVLSGSWSLGEAERKQLFDWVRAGGHVVLAPSSSERSRIRISPFDDDDADSSEDDKDSHTEQSSNEPASAGALLKEFGVTRARKRDMSRNTGAARQPMTIIGSDTSVIFSTYARLQSNNVKHLVRAADSHGACVIEGRYGRGSFTAMCSMRALQNSRVGKAQNATFLWSLVTQRSPTEPVWMVYDTDMPPLHQWLWERIPQTVVCVLLALLVWLWSSTRRAGPMLDLEPPGNRRTLEHVEASGRFVYKHEGPAPLLAAIRNDFQARLQRRHPAIAKLNDPERFHQLAKLCELSADEVFRALTVAPRHEAGFIEAVRHLQRLRESV